MLLLYTVIIVPYLYISSHPYDTNVVQISSRTAPAKVQRSGISAQQQQQQPASLHIKQHQQEFHDRPSTTYLYIFARIYSSSCAAYCLHSTGQHIYVRAQTRKNVQCWCCSSIWTTNYSFNLCACRRLSQQGGALLYCCSRPAWSHQCLTCMSSVAYALMNNAASCGWLLLVILVVHFIEWWAVWSCSVTSLACKYTVASDVLHFVYRIKTYIVACCNLSCCVSPSQLSKIDIYNTHSPGIIKLHGIPCSWNPAACTVSSFQYIMYIIGCISHYIKLQINQGSTRFLWKIRFFMLEHLPENSG